MLSDNYFVHHLQMAAATLTLQLVYIMKVADEYVVNWIFIVTLIACHFTHFHFTETLGYTSKPIQPYTEFHYSEYRSSI